MRVALVPLCVMALAGCASSEPCPCRCPAQGILMMPTRYPQPDRSLPPNGRVLLDLGHYVDSSLLLEDDASRSVPFTLEAAGDAAGRAFWLVPASELPAGHYTLAATHDTLRVDHLDLDVAGEPDTTPAVLSGFEIGASSPAGGPCGGLVGGLAGRLQGFVADGGYVMNEHVALDIELIDGATSLGHVFPVGAGDLGGSFGTAGVPDCMGTGHIDGLRVGVHVTAHARAWDVAGHVTDLGTFDVTPSTSAPDTYPCARWCSAAAGRPTPAPTHALALLAVALLARLVRRRGGARFCAPSATTSRSNACAAADPANARASDLRGNDARSSFPCSARCLRSPSTEERHRPTKDGVRLGSKCR